MKFFTMIPHNLRRHFEILQKYNVSLNDLFVISPTPLKEKILRKYASTIVNTLPTQYRYLFTNIIKRIRNPKGELRLNYPLYFQECQLIADEVSNLNLSPWWDKKAVICLSHDIDNIEGYKFVSKMAEIDAQYEVQSTFNFLTHDYMIDKSLIHSLLQHDFEIGLHGYIHDQGIAFRKPDNIKDYIRKSLEVLGNGALGYRSPALSLSRNLLWLLGEMHFLYDSTMQIASPFYNSVKIPYPYYLKQFGIWEVPLMVQDDNYFRDTKTPEKDILTSIQRFIKETIAVNGVFVINMHPHVMVNHKSFYTMFLQYIQQFKEDVVYLSTKTVIEYVQNNTKGSPTGGFALPSNSAKQESRRVL
jgi:hypothetical protein